MGVTLEHYTRRISLTYKYIQLQGHINDSNSNTATDTTIDLYTSILTALKINVRDNTDKT